MWDQELVNFDCARGTGVTLLNELCNRSARADLGALSVDSYIQLLHCYVVQGFAPALRGPCS
jgi:hypothetical protein